MIKIVDHETMYPMTEKLFQTQRQYSCITKYYSCITNLLGKDYYS